MTYRATITSALGLYVMGVVFAGLLVISALLSQPVQILPLLAGLAVVAWLIAIRVRYLVRVSRDELQARSLIRDSRVKWHDIVRVSPATQRGYWASRLFGPSVLEFVAHDTTTRINFKLFPAECLRDVLRHVPEGAHVRG